MYKAKTLRRMPERTREIARLVNELESATRRLANRVPRIRELESNANALDRVLEGPDKRILTFTIAEVDTLTKMLTWAQNEDGIEALGWSEDQLEAFEAAWDKLTKGHNEPT